jgi:hypothetical protein
MWGTITVYDFGMTPMSAVAWANWRTTGTSPLEEMRTRFSGQIIGCEIAAFSVAFEAVEVAAGVRRDERFLLRLQVEGEEAAGNSGGESASGLTQEATMRLLPSTSRPLGAIPDPGRLRISTFSILHRVNMAQQHVGGLDGSVGAGGNIVQELRTGRLDARGDFARGDVDPNQFVDVRRPQRASVAAEAFRGVKARDPGGRDHLPVRGR